MREIPLILNHPFTHIELSYWLDYFDSPACKVTGIEGDGYYLTACRLEKLADVNMVRESAEKLIIMMTAIAKIEHGTDFQSIVRDDEHFISGFREHLSDKDVSHVFLKAPSSYDFGPKGTVVSYQLDKNGNPIPPERQERWYEYYVNRCDDWIDSTKMFEALSYFAEKTEARTVRLAYETIEEDEGSKTELLKNNHWVTKKELSKFTCSINRRDIDGPELHVKNTDPKCNMNLAEARMFLAQRLLKPWLIKKRDIYKKLAAAQVQAKYLASKLNI